MVNAPDFSPPARQQNVPTAARPEVTLVSGRVAGQLDLAHEFHIAISEAVQTAGTTRELWRAEFEIILAPFLAEQERARAEFARMGESLRAISTGWAEAVAKQSQAFSNIIAPALEETRIRKTISDLGFVPHAVLFKHVGECGETLATDNRRIFASPSG
jgi:hypothetical protein